MRGLPFAVLGVAVLSASTAGHAVAASTPTRAASRGTSGAAIASALGGPCEAPVIKWEQLPDGSSALSSQDDTAYPFTTEIADDFIGDGTLVLGVGWWGGYWNGEPVLPDGFHLRIYTTTPDTLPDAPVYEAVVTEFNETAGSPRAYCALFGGAPFEKADSVAYFVSVQAQLQFPPQWGWATGTGNGQQLRVRAALFGYPDWTVGSQVFAQPYDMAFRLLNATDTPVEATTWGLLKSFYR